MFTRIYMLYSYTHIYLLSYVLLQTMKKLHIYLQVDIQLQRQELFKLWIQKKEGHSNIRSEYVPKSVMDMYGCFCL